MEGVHRQPLGEVELFGSRYTSMLFNEPLAKTAMQHVFETAETFEQNKLKID